MKKLIYGIASLLMIASCGRYEDVYIEIKQFPDYDWVAAADSSSTQFAASYWNTSLNHFNNNMDGSISRYDYWPEAHGLDAITDAYIRTGDDLYKQIIYDFFDGVKAKNGGSWENDYYDDMAWHGVAHLRAFEVTGDTRYEESALELWKWITLGWNDYDGGGIQWRKGDDEVSMSKGIPANGPAAIIAARRAQLYPDEVVNGHTNMEWALMIYEWMKYNRVELATGRVYEVFEDTRSDYGYDYGTFTGTALELYKITGEKMYLNDAIKVCNYHMGANVNENYRVLTDYGEQSGENGGGHDCNLFKGIFIRYFTLLIQNPDLPEVDRKRFVLFIKNNANYLWTYGTQKSPVVKFGFSWWTIPEEGVKWGDLRSAISGATTIEAMALLEKGGYLNQTGK